MSTLDLVRSQVGITTVFHFIFVPMSIGLAAFVALCQTLQYRTGKDVFDPEGGRVTFEGVDVRRLSQDDLRRAVLLCGQDAQLFNTTIRENLLIGRRAAGEDELWAALEAVELNQFVAALPNGLETCVDERGELLSGGQGQRVALARAILSDACFLILDEPLAHLDAPLTRRVMRRVLDQSAARGVLVITHATDAFDGFDRVVRLERGRLEPIPADCAAAGA